MIDGAGIQRGADTGIDHLDQVVPGAGGRQVAVVLIGPREVGHATGLQAGGNRQILHVQIRIAGERRTCGGGRGVIALGGTGNVVLEDVVVVIVSDGDGQVAHSARTVRQREAVAASRTAACIQRTCDDGCPLQPFAGGGVLYADEVVVAAAGQIAGVVIGPVQGDLMTGFRAGRHAEAGYRQVGIGRNGGGQGCAGFVVGLGVAAGQIFIDIVVDVRIDDHREVAHSRRAIGQTEVVAAGRRAVHLDGVIGKPLPGIEQRAAGAVIQHADTVVVAGMGGNGAAVGIVPGDMDGLAGLHAGCRRKRQVFDLQVRIGRQRGGTDRAGGIVVFAALASRRTLEDMVVDIGGDGKAQVADGSRAIRQAEGGAALYGSAGRDRGALATTVIPVVPVAQILAGSGVVDIDPVIEVTGQVAIADVAVGPVQRHVGAGFHLRRGADVEGGNRQVRTVAVGHVHRAAGADVVVFVGFLLIVPDVGTHHEVVGAIHPTHVERQGDGQGVAVIGMAIDGAMPDGIEIADDAGHRTVGGQ